MADGLEPLSAQLALTPARTVGTAGPRPTDPAAAAGKLKAEREALAPTQVEGLVNELNTRMGLVQRDLKFSVDEGSGRIVIEVLDAQTDEVIRQIPPEEIVGLIERLRDGSSGLFNGEV